MDIIITKELLNKVKIIINGSKFINCLLDITDRDLEASGFILQMLLNEIEKFEKEVNDE